MRSFDRAIILNQYQNSNSLRLSQERWQKVAIPELPKMDDTKK
jgi:hypothetical protein